MRDTTGTAGPGGRRRPGRARTARARRAVRTYVLTLYRGAGIFRYTGLYRIIS